MTKGAERGWCQLAERDFLFRKIAEDLWGLGELLGGLDYAVVPHRIRRTNSIYNPIAARRLITTVLNV